MLSYELPMDEVIGNGLRALLDARADLRDLAADLGRHLIGKQCFLALLGQLDLGAALGKAGHAAVGVDVDGKGDIPVRSKGAPPEPEIEADLFGLLAAFKLLRPAFPSEDKALIYECGEKPIGTAWFNFNPRFYLVALVFVIFEVDIALTFPVATVYRDWVAAADPSFAWVAFAELFLFTAILVVGLVWVWAHGDLEWVKKLAVVDEGIEAPQADAPTTSKAASRACSRRRCGS